MDLLLIHPGVKSDVISEHLGIASLKAFLTQYGFKVDILDMALENLDIPAVIQKMQHLQPGSIGISMLDQTKEQGLSLFRQIKQAGFSGPLIAGGYFPTFHAEELLKNVPAIDFIVRGEGEHTLLDLMYSLSGRGNKSLCGISGISYHLNGNGQLRHNPPRPLIYDLDSLPMADRKYADRLIKKTGHLRVYASRGCWGNCSFCDINSFYSSSPGKKWRSRSIAKFVDELEHLARTYRCNYFILNDDNFLTRGVHNRQRAENLATELARRNLSVSFEMMSRVDSIDRQVLVHLKRAGLQRVFLGIESFDQDQLDRFGKGTTVRQNLKALITLKRLKIDCIVSVILADAYTRLRDLIKQYFVLFMVQKKYFNSKDCRISINERLELYRGSFSYRQYKQAGLLTSDHWYDGYDFRLKKLTAWRLKLARLENKIYKKFSGWKKNHLNRSHIKPVTGLRNDFSSQLLKISKN